MLWHAKCHIVSIFGFHSINLFGKNYLLNYQLWSCTIISAVPKVESNLRGQSVLKLTSECWYYTDSWCTQVYYVHVALVKKCMELLLILPHRKLKKVMLLVHFLMSLLQGRYDVTLKHCYLSMHDCAKFFFAAMLLLLFAAGS